MAEPKRDLVVSPGSYAYLRDGTKGTIKVFTGPTVATPSAQDEGIVYNDVTQEYDLITTDLNAARRKSPETEEGSYCVLRNPAENGKFPSQGQSSSTDTVLMMGRKVVIPGPTTFSLWPGQTAKIIPGHQLRSNQYLVARVYNEDEARKNWGKAIMKPASQVTPLPENPTEEQKKVHQAALEKERREQPETLTMPTDMSVGRLFVIKGTEVSFYIPPTGISVMLDTNEDGTQSYVREALTLESLEYAILLDEKGNKRYVKGPNVVFPTPIEQFMTVKTDEGFSKKSRAIELNELQGIHLKVIADFEEKGKKYKTGEELFLTGKDTQIFFPREELSAIKYDGSVKSFATAVPLGEARYVLNRLTGDIKMVRGPAMLLPDPRSEVIVRRILSDKQASLWYPGNAEALAYNQNLRKVLAAVPTTRGAPSEGDVLRNYKNQTQAFDASLSKSAVVGATMNMAIADNSRVSRQQAFGGEEFVRASNFTQPRSVTLDTKYQGVPVVEVWTGYAVLVVNKNGKRRVVKGPSVVQLEYDETCEVLELSTGKPKTTDNLLRTVFLRTDNNQITDIINLETADHIPVEVRLQYRVNFEGDAAKWWNVENYVKFLCDEVRSLLKGQIKKVKIEDFDANATDLIRNLIIGAPKAAGDGVRGRLFSANDMRVTDVEVLGFDIKNPNVKQALVNHQLQVVNTNIELAQLRRGKDVTQQREEIQQEEARIRAETTKIGNELQADLANSQLELSLLKYNNTMKEIEERKKAETASEALNDFRFDTTLARQKKESDQRFAQLLTEQELALQKLDAETKAVAARFKAGTGEFASILAAITDKETVVRIAEAMNMTRAIGGESFADAASKVFGSLPSLAPILQRLAPGVNPVSTNGASADKKPVA